MIQVLFTQCSSVEMPRNSYAMSVKNFRSYAAYDLEPAAHESQHGMRPLMLRKHF